MPAPDPKRPDTGLSLSPGERLGPYEIVGPLGVGGMGEVYRARDPRLRRDVAIKILHRSLGAEHVERLVREARAAGSLNHPNIVAVYDVGTDGPVPYVVSELLEGESLRARMSRAPLPYRKALEYGIQMAQALGAAHERGIWHRDVKPTNAFITSDGRLKLLDFGLVKLKAPGRPIGSQDSTPVGTTTADETRPGAVAGTIGYMSPEQTLGEPVDHRTDIFALGAVLYEMLAGVPAFRVASATETTRAVLAEDPIDLLERNSALPPAAAAVVRRCLEKNREARYQSARDLAFQLQQLQEMTAPPRPPSGLGRARHLVVLSLVGLALAAGLVAFVLAMRRRPAPTFEQLTFSHGRIGGARFASQGGAVLYSEARQGKPLEVWWLSGPDSPESRLVGHRGSDVLSVRGGKLALSLSRRFLVGERFVGTLAQAPIGEGAPLELAANVEDADWDPSGTQLAVARSPSAGEESRLEYPIGRVLYKTSGSIRHPRFSHDGRQIAFLEDPTGRGAGGRVTVLDLEGQVRSLTEEWTSAHGLAWSPAGDEVWFAAGERRTTRALRAVDLKRHQRLILGAPASITLWDVSPDGRVLLSRDDERSALRGVSPGESAERDLSWFDSSGVAALSEDGRSVLFDDLFGVYVRGTDGSPPVRLRLKDGFGDDFSPDGKSVLATSASGDQLVVLPGFGEPRPLPAHGISAYRGALWFPDGRRVLFNGTRPGGSLRSYVQDLKGGAPAALTPDSTWVLSISPDGGWVAAIGPDEGVSIWPVAGGEPRAVPSSRPGDRPVAWSDDGRWLWVFRRGEMPAEVSRLEIATGRRQLWKRLQPPDSTGVYSIYNVKITRDGRAYAYSYKRVVSQLYLGSGLR